MIEIFIQNNSVILNYTPEIPIKWIKEKFENNEIAKIKNTFYFTRKDLINKDYLENKSNIDENFDEYMESLPCNFILAELIGDYYKIDKRKLSISVDVYFHKTIDIELKYFCTNYNVSIFKKITSIINEDIYITSNEDEGFSIFALKKLIKYFPRTTELRKYVEMRVGAIIEDYFSDIIDTKMNFEKYMNKKISYKGVNLLKDLRPYELEKYRFILSKLRDMLKNQVKYNEKQWQKEIIQIIQLLYPKYIIVMEELKIFDSYNKKERFIDIALCDSNGNLDIIEIKRPMSSGLISSNTYRDNYIPLKDLSGTIMQVEKYLFYLKEYGISGEKILNERYRKKLPDNIQLKIRNPSGIIIMGREFDLNNKQKMDLEIIKRKYKNIIDIITYDEIIKRLEVAISNFENEQKIDSDRDSLDLF